jgi:hypothetical protein
MRNHAADHDLFIANTKKLRILTGGDKFNQYHQFLLSALELLIKEKNFPAKANEWIDAARACLDRKISLEDARKIQEEIKGYKIKLQKSGDSFEEGGSEEFVIAELLQFAVEHPDDERRVDTRGTDISNGTGLVQAIDEFSLLFIEYFGRGSDLVRLLKESFE